MPKTLVIVESPAKARTIERFLKTGYEVLASYGHVRDLPESADEIPDEIRKKKWGRIGVDTEGDFKPYYVIPNDKRKYVQALRAALKGATQVYLATDPDREGESISWHLKEILKPRVPVKRIVFHEITEEAIKQAVKDAQDIDENLVRAQESRRILDRLYGYTISPVLWKKVQTSLTATLCTRPARSPVSTSFQTTGEIVYPESRSRMRRLSCARAACRASPS